MKNNKTKYRIRPRNTPRAMFAPGDVVVNCSRLFKVVGREEIMPTKHRRYVIQDIKNPESFFTARVDTLTRA